MLTLAEICRVNNQTRLLSLQNLNVRRIRSHCVASRNLGTRIRSWVNKTRHNGMFGLLIAIYFTRCCCVVLEELAQYTKGAIKLLFK